MDFLVGDRVEVVDYGGRRLTESVVVSAFSSLSHGTQYVVEDSRGVLSVCKPRNLRHFEVFKVGDKVVKVGGDYRFDGVVVAAFTKRSGLCRYVVEDDRGILHIFSANNLRRHVACETEPSKEDSQ